MCVCVRNLHSFVNLLTRNDGSVPRFLQQRPIPTQCNANPSKMTEGGTRFYKNTEDTTSKICLSAIFLISFTNPTQSSQPSPSKGRGGTTSPCYNVPKGDIHLMVVVFKVSILFLSAESNRVWIHLQVTRGGGE